MNEPQADTSPTVSPREEPPLSIAHLMLWAACVAIYLSALQTAALSYEMPSQGGLQTAFWAIHGIFQGTAIAGILLLIIRRARGIKFPRHDGEMLWIILGVQAAISLFGHITYALSHHYWIARYFSFRLAEASTFLPLYSLFFLVIWGAVYLYAILQAKTRRWRVVFVLMMATSIATPILLALVARLTSPTAMASVFVAARFPQQLVIGTSLLVASWIDLRQPDRYPWSHWTGVILYLLRFTGTILAFVALFLMGS